MANHELIDRANEVIDRLFALDEAVASARQPQGRVRQAMARQT
jgi:hypothetical protein